jgi:hypothetical protein
MTELDATKKILKEVVERYEEMFAQFYAIRTVFAGAAEQDASLLAKYAEALLGTNFRMDIHAKFVPLYAGISTATQETEVLALIATIPLVPKVR